MHLQQIKNYLQVTNSIASSGQPARDQFRLIAAQGYRGVINLAMPDSENAIPDEGEIVTGLGMVYVHIPVPFTAPEKTHLDQFMDIMNSFTGRNVWAHCVVNHRVSAFLYLYLRLALKINHEDASKAVLPSWNPNKVWREFMKIDGNRI